MLPNSALRHRIAGAALLAAVVALTGCTRSLRPLSTGIKGGPSVRALKSKITGATPEETITKVWQVLRNDDILVRSFVKVPKDSTQVASMESDWVYVPRVLSSALFGSMREPEKWVKFLFWAEPRENGTLLSMDILYNPTNLPTQPVQWERLRTIPATHPAWSYVDVVISGIERRLGGGS